MAHQRTALTFSVTALLIIGVLFYFAYDHQPKSSAFQPRAMASAGDNIFGWAWSSNIGWISFNDQNPGSGGGFYGVNADASGNLSGYTWSPNIGWISFSHSSNCPTAPGNPVCQPKINFTTREVSGFARACAGTVVGDCSSDTRTDGWDGWISLRGSGPDYGVITTAAPPYYWSGWAWGGPVLGWLSFSGTASGGGGYGVFGPTSGIVPMGPPPFVVSANGSPNPAEVGKLVTWSALVSGGTPPYIYSWSGTDGLSGSGVSVQKTYTSIGVKTGTVIVKDSSVPQMTQSASFDVSVIPPRKIGGIKEIQPE